MSIRIALVALLLIFLAATGLAQDQGAPTGIITRIDIEGTEHTNKQSILTVMKTKVGDSYIQSHLDDDQAAIYSLGFFSAVDVNATPDASNWIVTVKVKEFPVVKEIRVVGNTIIPTDAILKVVTVKIGEPYNQRAGDPTEIAISKLYRDKGYFALVRDIEPEPESPGTINIAIKEMRVASVGVEGNVRTRNSVMKKLIHTKPGDAYNINKWDDDLKRIYSTRWFEKVDQDENASEDQSQVDLLAVVKETHTGNATVGVSLSPTTGLAGTASVGDSNLNGTGQSVGISFMEAITGGGPSVTLNYGNPFIDSNGTGFSASIYSQLIYRFSGSGLGEITNTSELYTERHTGASVGLTKSFGEIWSGGVGLKAENVNTSHIGSIPPASLVKQDDEQIISSFYLTQDRRDLALDPSRGDWLNFTTQPGVADIRDEGGALSNANALGTHLFAQNTLEYRAYFTNQPPRGRAYDAPRRTFAFRARYGYLGGVPPFFEQYFLGGADTLRGYDDDRFWGTQELLATLEYRYPIQKSFSIIPFVDYGGAWGGYGTVNGFNQYTSMRLHFDGGLGVSFKTPLGQIRIDFAVNENGGNRTTFLLGAPF